MKLQLVHERDDSVEVQCRGRLLFRYNYAPAFDSVECRKPYMHPIRTLAGNEVTVCRPEDHPWHKGLSMTMANLSGENFWGGPTYLRGKGYAQLDNVGRMQHCGWDELLCRDDHAILREKLQWITRAGETWIEEQRTMEVCEVRPELGYWSLGWDMRLNNVRGESLQFGSPTTEGRENAGYGGLFWRGPASFLNGGIMAAGNLEGPDVMGKSAPWICYHGRHDRAGAASSILFIDSPANVAYPNKWFVRNDPYACISCAFSFDRVVTLDPGMEMILRYRVVFANGTWDRERIETYVSAGKTA